MSDEKNLVLAINGGSSSIKFALFEVATVPLGKASGRIENIGSDRAVLLNTIGGKNTSRQISAPNHSAAVGILADWIQAEVSRGKLVAIGHRVVHGGPKYWRPERVTAEMLEELRTLGAFDPQHLPGEIALMETFARTFADLPQVACFDTAFHHDLPRVAQLLPIPRAYEAKGIRRYGFHGLSYTFLLHELERVAGKEAAQGKVVLAHLGSGVSLAAVDQGRPIDTSMAFTPAAGLPMSTRSGDLDPGLAWYLAQTEQMSGVQFNQMVNQRSGLLGISETTSDMEELLAREANDPRAAEAIALFCYSIKKCIGSYAAALGGLDTLVFAGGVGERAPLIRERICQGLGFLGLVLNQERNADNEHVISTTGNRVTVRIIPTDEEIVIAKSVVRLLQLG